MLGFGIACIFITSPILQLIYSALATIMFSIYLIYDTQMVVGKQDRAFSLDDAYLAALHLYMDVVQLFLQILRLVSAFQN